VSQTCPKGVAAVLSLLLLGDDAALLEVASPAANLVRGLDPDAEMRKGTGRRALQARLEREMDLRVRVHELGVVGLPLARLTEEPPIELDRLREIRDIEGNVDRGRHGDLHI
jgi:hypothetical protein